MFCFFCHGRFRSLRIVLLSNAEFIIVPTTSSIDDLGPLKSVQAIFVRNIGFDAACALEVGNMSLKLPKE